nr:MAG TPA: hypothetical protein [Crassvirales sp.]
MQFYKYLLYAILYWRLKEHYNHVVMKNFFLEHLTLSAS